MGGDDLHASLAHVVLCCVAGRGISRGSLSSGGWTRPGMHANFFFHGLFGFFNSQSGLLNNDFASIFAITTKSTRYLALPCLMADMYRSQREISLLHLASGLVPFAMVLSGKDNPHLGNMMVAVNIVSLLYYSVQNNRTYGYYTVAAALVAYFMSPQMGTKAAYPLALALMEYCAYRLFFFVL